MIHPKVAKNWSDYLSHAAIGDLPGWLTLGFLLLFGGQLSLVIRHPAGAGDVLHRK